MTKVRLPALVATVMALLALGASPAAAGGTADPPIRTDWAGPTIALDWQNQPRQIATESFIGTPVTVPGDRAGRTVTVTNAASGVGTLTATITDVSLAGSSDGFFDELLLRWSTEDGSGEASLDQLAGEDHCFAAVVVQPGQSTSITVEYLFPREATSGNRSLAGHAEARFDVGLRLVSGSHGTCETDGGDPDDGEAAIDTGLVGPAGGANAFAAAIVLLGMAMLLAALFRRSRQRR